MPSWSGLWNREYNENYSGLGGNNTAELSNNEKMQLARGFRGRQGRVVGAIIKALTGNTVGQTAASSVKRIAADPHLSEPYAGGGVRTISSVDEINRVTVAADATTIDALVDLKTAPTYPVDKSGNGGGGKLGTL
jgi:hypothetical protein